MAASTSTLTMPKTPEEGLTPAQLRQWDRFAVGMQRYHDHFASEFKDIYRFADAPERLGMDMDDFIMKARSLSQYLHMHHGIEERHIFPFLAARMPEFQESHPEQHKKIHAGLDQYDAVLQEAMRDMTKYNPAKLREVMDGFRDVLFTHLDEEVHSLRGKNMRRYWTLKELEALPF